MLTIKCCRCGNELSTRDRPDSAICRDCERKEAEAPIDEWNPGIGEGTPEQWRAFIHRNKQHCPVCAEWAFQIIDTWEKEVEGK